MPAEGIWITEFAQPQACPAFPKADQAVAMTQPVDHPDPTDPASPRYVTPLVRKLADDAGVCLATVLGTGVGGRIRKQDVLDVIDQRARAEQAAAAARLAAETPAADAADILDVIASTRSTTTIDLRFDDCPVQLSLAYDPQSLDSAKAVRFLGTIKARLEAGSLDAKF